MTDKPRLIEVAFPLKQASLTSVHEKNVRHGHISTLHIWPARRPLAACRAALIATLLPDPSAEPKPADISEDAWHEEIIRRRRELCEKIGGKLVKKTERKKMPDGSIIEREKEETEGGILHWGRETENKADLDWFRAEIKKAYGGRTPKVLDPFAGGGAIPLEAMRLGCEATAVDINPVAWFILKCTLEYPQKLAGQTHPLPDFILQNEEFMDAFYRAHPHLVGRTKKTRKQAHAEAGMFPSMVKEDSGRTPKADLAWHVRAWGQWVLARARQELARFYPTYADFETLPLTSKERGDGLVPRPFEKRPMQLVPLKGDGTSDINALNAEFSTEYLADKKNPRWIAKPTVAYLWARTVTCKNCRATLPLLKTRWLCKKKDGDRKRVLLIVTPRTDGTGVTFGVESDVPMQGGNAAQKREHDKRIGSGTMTKAGAKCPCCPTIMTSEDIRVETRAGRSGTMPIVVATDGQRSKEFRVPTAHEISVAELAAKLAPDVLARLPDGDLTEATPAGGGRKASRAFSLHAYGMTAWRDLFTKRQRLALASIGSATIDARREMGAYDDDWREAISSYAVCGLQRLVDFANVNVQWKIDVPTINHALVRFAIQITWDFAEGNPVGVMAGSYIKCLERIAAGIDTLAMLPPDLPAPRIIRESSTRTARSADLIVTDPPYYDAIPYSDLMDWFYVWLRRVAIGISPAFTTVMNEKLGPKWDSETMDGELIDDDTRHENDTAKSKRAYEDGMTEVFHRCSEGLTPTGRMVLVFANKHPDAWETLVASLIRAGFVVDASWPIQTEQPSRTRGISSAALASSVWLVCKKRPATARPGWDNQVLEEMRTNIREMLREFWDAGIRGPDFVWAATGPAMEAYSKHPVVKKANEPGPLTVSEFLTHVRRIVVDFVVGRVLSGDQDGDADTASADRLDEPTAYYLLHRHDFGMDEAPAGACILYAISCGLSDRELAGTWDLIGYAKGRGEGDDEEESDADAESDAETDDDSGSKVKLKTWAQRKGKSMGYEAPGGQPVPLIDRVHCLMHLWKAGDLSQVDAYLDGNGLRRQELFKRLLQSLIELSPHGSEERSLLESLSNHIGARGAMRDDQLQLLAASRHEEEL